MSHKLLVVVSILATLGGLRGGGAIAADRPPFCGTARWQPTVHEAADRFGLPATWLDAVIRAESAGCEVMDGSRTTSSAGAMGLMQLMPETWKTYRVRLRLGDDPYGARDNIMAGAAYLSDLYRRFGSSGFLAAYQAGPKRYEEFLDDGRPLPRQTVDYIARVHRAIQGIDSRSAVPQSRDSPAASALFVTLAAPRSTSIRSPVDKLDTRLFVQLSNARIATKLPPSRSSSGPLR
jgi:hypothetical protein